MRANYMTSTKSTGNDLLFFFFSLWIISFSSFFLRIRFYRGNGEVNKRISLFSSLPLPAIVVSTKSVAHNVKTLNLFFFFISLKKLKKKCEKVCVSERRTEKEKI